MSKVNIDQFYDRYRGYINVASSYMEEKRVPFILKACRLRPYDSLLAPLPITPHLERRWVDEFGNSFYIGKNKRLKIIYGDLKIDRTKIQTTDLYANVSLRDLYRISKFLYICLGTYKAPDETGNNEIFILSFLGRDNYFRTRVLVNGIEDKTISTLYLGYQLLKMIATYTDIRYYHKLTTKSILPSYPLVNVRQWVSFLPAHSKLASELNAECQLATKTIGMEII